MMKKLDIPLQPIMIQRLAYIERANDIIRVQGFDIAKRPLQWIKFVVFAEQKRSVKEPFQVDIHEILDVIDSLSVIDTIKIEITPTSTYGEQPFGIIFDTMWTKKLYLIEWNLETTRVHELNHDGDEFDVISPFIPFSKLIIDRAKSLLGAN